MSIPTRPQSAGANERLLTSLAILKANWDQGNKSYLDNFLPFLADCMRSCGTPEVSARQLSRHLQDRFGIPLPDGVIQSLLRKAARKGLGSRSHGVFAIDKAEVAKFDLTRPRSDAVRRQEALLDRLQRFSREEHSVELSRDDAEVALLGHLEEHSTSILRSALRGAAYQPSLGAAELDYIVSSFIVHTFARDPEGFDYLESVVKGLMLASALYLPTPGDVGRRFDKVTLLFDTRLLLQALGYEGPEAEASMRQTLDLSYQLGAQLAVFTETLAETRGVLNAISSNINRPGRNGGHRRSTESWFLKQGYSSSDIELLAEGLEDDLRGLRVSVVDRPVAVVSLTVDENELERRLQERLGYQSRPALLHDLDALTAVYRLRGGQRPGQLERCRALFITNNTPLVAIGRQFFHDGDAQTVPVALSDDDLATLVWLKRPLDAPDLPRIRIIADCYAALEPGNELWGKYLDEVDRLKERGSLSEDDFFLLRYSLDAKQALMDRTLGTVDRVDAAVVESVLERAKDSIRQPQMERAKEAEASSSTAARATAEATARAASAERRADEAEARARKAEAAASQIVDAQRRHARNLGQRRGRTAKRLALAVLTLSAVAVGYLSLPSALDLPPETFPSSVKWPLRVVLGAFMAVLVACQFTGHSLAALARNLEIWVGRRTERRALSTHGLPDEPSILGPGR